MNTSKEINERVDELEKRIEKIEKLFSGDTVVATKTKKFSAKEFLLAKSPNSEGEKVLALAYYLEHNERMPHFNVPDLETVFRLAKEKVPKNINDAVNRNIARGFIMEAAEKKDLKKTWCLTSTGERYVETELSK